MCRSASVNCCYYGEGGGELRLVWHLSQPHPALHWDGPGGPQDQPWAAPFTEADVQQLQEMGFGDAARCRAALAASRGDVAAAVGWLMMDPIPALSLATVSTPPPPRLSDRGKVPCTPRFGFEYFVFVLEKNHHRHRCLTAVDQFEQPRG